MLPRGDEMARGDVMAQSCNASGNIMGRAHANPIMVPDFIKSKSLGARLQS